MNKKANSLLLITILIVAIDSIIMQFDQRQSFKELQQLNMAYDQLISTHKSYLSQYKREYSLLEIEDRATRELSMKVAKWQEL